MTLDEFCIYMLKRRISKYDPIIKDGLVFYAPLNSMTQFSVERKKIVYSTSKTSLSTIDNITGLNPSNGQLQGVVNGSGYSGFTMSVFINMNAITANPQMWLVSNVIKVNNIVRYPALYILPISNTCYFYCYNQQLQRDDVNAAFNLPSTFDFSKWHHFAITYDRSNFRIYVDGTLYRTVSLSYPAFDYTIFQHDGRSSGKTFAGLRIYSRALSANEITALSQEFTYPIEPEIAQDVTHYTFPLTSLTANCYKNYFNGNSALSSVAVKFTEWNDDEHSTDNWLSGVAESGFFFCPSALCSVDSTDAVRDSSHIPSGWRIMNYETLYDFELNGDHDGYSSRWEEIDANAAANGVYLSSDFENYSDNLTVYTNGEISDNFNSDLWKVRLLYVMDELNDFDNSLAEWDFGA